MINLIAFFVLTIDIFLNYLILSKLNKTSMILKGSMLFFVNALMIIGLIFWFTNIASIENISESIGIDKLITFNAVAVKIRNTIIVVSLFYLSYGIYRQYDNSKKKLLLVAFCLLIALSILYLILTAMAGSFIM
jgi:hypothetical protein